MIKIVNRKSVVISLILVAVMAALFVLPRMLGSARGSTATEVQYTTLAKTEIVDSISVSGTVISANSTNVYNNLTYKVKKVYVKEGDVVKAGNVLATLDSSNLNKDIEQSTYSTNAAEQSAAIDLENKTRAYDYALNQYNNGLNVEIANAQASLTSAQLALEKTQSSYDYNKFLYDWGEISKLELATAQSDLTNAQANYDKASATLESTKNKVDQDLKRAENDYKAALAASQNKSQRVALEKLEQQLKDTAITAPVNGTVTMVNATVGTAGNGVLFVVEDVNHLIVSTSVKESDIGKLKIGQKAVIKTDATGDAIMAGEVSSIDPATMKNASGETVFSSDVSFDVDVAITQGDPILKIGMSARLNITLAEKSDIYAVPYDAVIQNADGKSVIYVAEPQGQNYIVQELPVEVGLENDFYVEILGNGVSDGLIVISNPSSFVPGAVVTINK